MSKAASFDDYCRLPEGESKAGTIRSLTDEVKRLKRELDERAGLIDRCRDLNDSIAKEVVQLIRARFFEAFDMDREDQSDG